MAGAFSRGSPMGRDNVRRLNHRAAARDAGAEEEEGVTEEGVAEEGVAEEGGSGPTHTESAGPAHPNPSLH